MAAGEFLVLVGPSGCGKSTLLNLIAGLDTVQSGEIAIDGQRVNERSPADRNIAMVFQSYALYPNMTVRANLGFGLRMRGVAHAAREKAIAEVAALLKIEELLDRKPRALSGGQRQRVAMGRALVRKPSLFLFDEPLSNLDARLRIEMRTLIKRLHQQLGTTTVYVTHDQIEAMTLATRIAVMNRGRLQQVGTPNEVYATPANLFVAGFMGAPSMNLIEAKLVRESGRVAVRFALADGGVATLALPSPDLVAGYSRDDVVLGVRPGGDHGCCERGSCRCAAVRGEPHRRHRARGLRYVRREPDGWHGRRGTVTRRREAAEPARRSVLAIDMAKCVLFDPATQERIGS